MAMMNANQENEAKQAGPKVCQGYISTPATPIVDMKMSDFEFLHSLGGGQYGKVFCANHKASNYVVAIKQLNIKKLAGFNVMSQLRREIEIAFNTRHPYLLRTFGYFYDDEDIYLVMEACAKGMLYSELGRVKKFPPAIAARYVAQLAEALLYLHSHHILHRDIKPENILIDHNNNMKLADFGWSVHDPRDRRKTACGTPEYFPPEIVARQVYDTTADLWCLGIFCYELLIGKTPFAAADQDAICKKIEVGEFSIPTGIPDSARALILSLLVKDGRKRLSLQRVLQHPFLVQYYFEPAGKVPYQPPASCSAAAAKRPREALATLADERPKFANI